MWGQQAPRLIALRKKALEALGTEQPFTDDIRLTLRVHVGNHNDRGSGDLDNYVAGVCDGLMAAHRNAKPDGSFEESENSAVHPTKPIAILDDSNVIKIDAEKLVGLEDKYWYEIELEGK